MVSPVHHMLWMFFIVLGGFFVAVVASITQLTSGRFDRRKVQRVPCAASGYARRLSGRIERPPARPEYCPRSCHHSRRHSRRRRSRDPGREETARTGRPAGRARRLARGTLSARRSRDRSHDYREVPGWFEPHRRNQGTRASARPRRHRRTHEVVVADALRTAGCASAAPRPRGHVRGCAQDLEPPTDCPAAAARGDGSHVTTLAR